MLHQNDISIWCNSDIFFDDTIQLVSKIGHNELWALARWEWRPDGSATHFYRPDSQDSWIVRGKVENVNANFPFGIPGSDNKLAYQFKEAGYKISNPSKTIKTYHVHNSNIRNYTRQETIPGPYHTFMPHDLE